MFYCEKNTLFERECIKTKQGMHRNHKDADTLIAMQVFYELLAIIQTGKLWTIYDTSLITFLCIEPATQDCFGKKIFLK